MGFCKSAGHLAVRLLLAAAAIGAVTSTTVSNTHPGSGEIDSSSVYTQEQYEEMFGGVDPVYQALLEEDHQNLVKRQSTGYTPIRGFPGTCQHRRKLEVLQSQYADQFNLFILALENIQKLSEGNELSYFGVMGIHGAPKIPWGQPAQGNYNYNLGYCTHFSALFSSWHRPYLLLMEQVIVEKARRIADQYSGDFKTRYKNAADVLRLPYWDWASQSDIPAVLMQRQIRVFKPNPGQPTPLEVVIPNPLYEYVFKSRTLQQQHFWGQFAQWTSTRRQPDASGNSNNTQANLAIRSRYSGRRQQTYEALTRPDRYNDFNDAIEGIHNTIHSVIGGQNGHMTYLDVSAFDPIFMMHHMNVDRLFAMWQAAHPGRYLQQTSATPTFARNINPNTCGCYDQLGTALFPFHLPNGQWWKTDHIKNARDIWTYGYGYDEVPCSYRGRSTAELETFTKGEINRLYRTTQQVGMSAQTVSAQSTDGNSAQRVSGAPTKNVRVRKDWSVHFLIDNSELDGTWNFHCFLGAPPAKVEEWALAENNLGTISSLGNKLLSSAQRDGKPVMKKQSGLFDKVIPLSEPILAAGLVKHEEEYKESNMVKFLTKNLNWRIEREGQELDLKTLKTLKVAVFSTDVEYPTEDDLTSFPVYGKPKYRPNITKGKAGGIANLKELDMFQLVDGDTVPVPDIAKLKRY